jgi:CheY-like chemotaxis protein
LGEPILLIDDEWRLVAVLRERLIAAGYDVHATLSAEDGWHMAHEHRPKVILVDICMPWIDGFEFCRRVRSAPELAHTPIVAISAIAYDSTRHAIVEAGATAFVAKPYVAKHLLQLIQNLIISPVNRSTLAAPADGAGEAI